MTTAALEPRTSAGDLRRVQLVAGGAALLIVAAVAVGVNAIFLMGLVAAVTGLAATHHWLLRWQTLLIFVVVAILFVPMKRYALFPGALPFQLEPYRILIACVALAWLGTVLIDPASRIRRTGFEGPFWTLMAVTMLSIAVNAGRVSGLGVSDVVLKKVTFLASFCIITYLVSSTIVRRSDIDVLVKVLVGAGALVAAVALYESRSGVNYFDQLQRIIPPLKFTPAEISETAVGRGGRLRVFASAEHPIALSAAFAMLVPFGIYLGRKTGRWGWWGATGLLAIGVFATMSRTGIVMLAAIGITYLVLKPAATRRALPALLPLLLAVQLVLPGAIVSLKRSFFPSEGLVASQRVGAGTAGSGRVADLGPGIAEWSRKPILGQGYGTRITDLVDPRNNATILDNQWLGTLLEVGLAGFLALVWLFVRALRRLGQLARRDETPHGWLVAGLAASIAAYGAGMFTFDALAFAQVTFLFFIALGLAGSALRHDGQLRAVTPT
jgi:polysaccharide biosynthesis protein PslJ